MKQKKQLSNGGYSLIELIVTILMSGIIVAAIAGFLTTGLKHYRVVNAETAVQTEAQVVELFVTELFQESTHFEVVSSFPVGSDVEYAVRVARGGTTYILAKRGVQLHFGAVDATKTDVEQITELVGQGKAKTFLGQYVNTFSLNANTDTIDEAKQKNGQVYLNLTFNVDGKIYDSTSIVTLRNTVKN